MAKSLYEFVNSKDEMVIQKADVDSQIITLATKEGAVDFIALEVSKIDEALSKMPIIEKPVAKNQISMKEFLSAVKTGMVNNPENFVVSKIKSLQEESAKLSVLIVEIIIEEEKP